VEYYKSLRKDQLLSEMERIDQEMFFFALFLNGRPSTAVLVEVPWGGKMNVVDVLFFLRDHDILHVGWNLALMDALKYAALPALIQYWG